MNKIDIAEKKYTGASEWNELHPDLLLRISFHLCKNSEPRHIKNQIAWRSTGIPYAVYSKLTSVQQHAIEDTFSFIFDKEKFSLTKIALPKIKINSVFYHPPSDEFRNSIVAEFITAEKHFSQYQDSKDKKHLALMAACLYRPGSEHNRDAHGDFREPFNLHIIEKRARLFAALPFHYLNLIMLNFSGVRKLMEHAHPHVFVKGNTGRGRNFGWAGIIVDTAGPKHGTADDVEQMTMWNLLFILEKNEVQRIEAESKLPKATAA